MPTGCVLVAQTGYRYYKFRNVCEAIWTREVNVNKTEYITVMSLLQITLLVGKGVSRCEQVLIL